MYSYLNWYSYVTLYIYNLKAYSYCNGFTLEIKLMALVVCKV